MEKTIKLTDGYNLGKDLGEIIGTIDSKSEEIGAVNLDFQDIGIITGRSLVAILQLRLDCINNNIFLRLSNVSDYVRSVFNVTGLENKFNIN